MPIVLQAPSATNKSAATLVLQPPPPTLTSSPCHHHHHHHALIFCRRPPLQRRSTAMTSDQRPCCRSFMRLYPSLRLLYICSASHNSRPRLLPAACWAGAAPLIPSCHANYPPRVSWSSTLQLLQHRLNASGKGILATSAFVVLVWRQDDHILWAFIGSILNTTVSRILKRVFNQQRPLTALHLKRDPGMPSSHAQTFAYFGLYAALGVMVWKGPNVHGVALASSIFLSCLYLAWLRCSQGLHTLLQVIVGVGFGYCMVVIWIGLWHYMVKELVFSASVYHNLLLGLFILSFSSILAFECKQQNLETRTAKGDLLH